ncbi:UNVERIFIED_CONTAM: hypothetical protein GTU68_056604 [Idotea baltica]|nr:hypothetical protein [Idotea baltica]
MNKQVADMKIFGIQSFCKDLLDVSDVLARAIESVPSDQLADGVNPPLKNMHDGLKMTESQLLKTFSKYGLEKINPTDGDKFDPNYHEALFQMPLSEGKVPGSVAQLSKVGYKLHDRTLRPASVGVYKQD